MTTLFWCIVIITAVHVFQVSGISIGTCNLDSEINLLSTKEKQKLSIRESVDSLCRDGADAQYIQYLSKSRITSPQTR